MIRDFIGEESLIQAEVGEVVPATADGIGAGCGGLQQRAATDQGAVTIVIGVITVGIRQLAASVSVLRVVKEISIVVIGARDVIGIGGNGISFQVRAFFANNGNVFIELITQLQAIEGAGFAAAAIKAKGLVVANAIIAVNVIAHGIKAIEGLEHGEAGFYIVAQYSAGGG